MTLKEKVKKQQPEVVDEKYLGGVEGCPHHYKFLNVTEEDEWRFCQDGEFCNKKTCTVCWNQKWRAND